MKKNILIIFFIFLFFLTMVYNKKKGTCPFFRKKTICVPTDNSTVGSGLPEKYSGHMPPAQNMIGESSGQALTLIEVKPKEKFKITLESNPTTGYSWQINLLDSKIIKLTETSFKLPEKNVVGAAGEEFWILEAQTQGEAEIVFSYLRPWEKDVPAIKEKRYKIIIK